MQSRAQHNSVGTSILVTKPKHRKLLFAVQVLLCIMDPNTKDDYRVRAKIKSYGAQLAHLQMDCFDIVRYYHSCH